MNGQSTISSAIGDDTIELELTPEQWLHLSEAAEAARQVESAAPQSRLVAGPVRSVRSVRSVRPVRRWHVAPIVKMSGYVIAYAAFAWWSVAQLSGEPQPPATTAVRPTVVIARPTAVASISKVAVKIINPFDAQEVFEFPAGTSDAEGQEKVAQILLQRARERQSQWQRIKPQISFRTASLYRSP